MLHAVSEYFNAGRPALTRFATYASGGYLVTKYIVQRLDDVRVRVVQDRNARDKCVTVIYD